MTTCLPLASDGNSPKPILSPEEVPSFVLGEQFQGRNLFIIPILDHFLLYAPLHNLAALVNHRTVGYLRDSLFSSQNRRNGPLAEIVHICRTLPQFVPLPKQGKFAPAFLGLLPTRGCNLSCRYCGFLALNEADHVMDLKLACDAIEWYLELVGESGQSRAEIHFFGGEPFYAEEVLDLTINLARFKAHQMRCAVYFEVATNGVFSEKRCRWAADSFDTIVLSLDGPADIQDRHRPAKNGRGSFAATARSAQILSEGPATLFFRSCVTAETVARMPEVAAWFCQNYRPQGVCFEPVQPLPHALDFLAPPDSWEFARNFIQAARILEAYGVEPIYAAADINSKRVSFCPVGQDVAIVSPDGAISACYLLRHDWVAQGLDLDLGVINDNGTVELAAEAVAFARSLNVWNKPFCAECFCKWHCAGGCHVNHLLPNWPHSYPRLCIQTRLITLRNILKTMDREDLVDQLLANPTALEKAIQQTSDTLIDREEGQ